ncbi:DUF418 domain-containing protein [Tsuneonella mangrovi]|uniref:DUF418 domain-containing protein n=1 Tax=Tsuneonella mangrovi TaxID=1982042 RepID=UPI001F0B0416|nr:DUF418 domain-containing protein [Tsuneonella mangrovi]
MASSHTPQSEAPAEVQTGGIVVPPPEPVRDRLASLDFIRGIAVMGILLANIVGFGQPFMAYAWPDGFATAHGPIDGWLWIAQFVLVDGKFRGLFSVLFGAGMVLFMDRAWTRGDTRWLQVKRLLWLLVFGLLHYFLLWRGDILTLYAVCGMVALACLRWKPETQLAVGLTGFVFGGILNAAGLWLFWASEGGQGGGAYYPAAMTGQVAQTLAEMKADAAIELANARHGSYADLVVHSVMHHGLEWLQAIAMVWTETIPLMLIGMALYRFGIFDGGVDRRDQLHFGWLGIAVGSALTVLLALWIRATGFTFAGTMFAFMGAGGLARLPVVLGMVALLAAWAPVASGWLGQRVVATGRMAFSNYIGTSLVMLFVFQPPGLRLFGQLTRPELYLVALAGCCVMLAWSKPWLARFGYGPLEWLWRCLTYRRLFAIRRKPAQSLA